MTRPDVRQWLESYFGAWRSNDPDHVASLFSADAVYSVSPFEEPWTGRKEIVERWTSGVGELLTYRYGILAAEGSRVVVHWCVEIQQDPGSIIELDGILVLDFNGAGECIAHREWYASRSTMRPCGHNIGGVAESTIRACSD